MRLIELKMKLIVVYVVFVLILLAIFTCKLFANTHAHKKNTVIDECVRCVIEFNVIGNNCNNKK